MNTSFWRGLFVPAFFHELESVGAAKRIILPSSAAVAFAEYMKDYPFSERVGRYGARGVAQNFLACEEENIPAESPARTLSRALGEVLNRTAVPERSDFFRTRLNFNDHLLLRYPKGEVGLGSHRDHSKYVNLIVSITLSGTAHFNLHDGPDGGVAKTFNCIPGTAIFMRSNGFLGENLRPYHSVTSIGVERISLILKQKEA